MSNQGIITIDTVEDVDTSEQLGVYLHWYGGRDRVEAFLKYCKIRGFRSPEEDNYGWARLTQIIANFIGGELSVGIDQCKNLNCTADNGVYLIEDWEIIGRQYFNKAEQNNQDLLEMLLEIDERQPEPLGEVVITNYLQKDL